MKKMDMSSLLKIQGLVKWVREDVENVHLDHSLEIGEKMPELILGIIKEALHLINTENGKALAIKIARFEEDFYEELSKGDKRDDARVDMLDRQLRELGELFLAVLKSSTPKG